MAEGNPSIKLWHPLDAQNYAQLAALEATFCEELFYGGERGGGKSDFQLGYQLYGAYRYGSGHRGIMFRKTTVELEELQGRAMAVFGDSGAIYKTHPSAGYPSSNCWYWPNDAQVKMRYIENEKDYGRYHGHSYSAISFDEVTEYATPAGLLKMLSTLRSSVGVPCTVRLTGNPGGVGHIWVKSRYVDIAPPLTPYLDPETGFTRMFVPSKLSDNHALSDPEDYRRRILAATQGNEALRKAWLEGDWNIVAGAFFDCWSPKMVLQPMELPKEWTRFRSGDWGSARPYSFGWWCVVQEAFEVDGQHIPRGALIRYRELYGAKDRQNQPNVGTKEDAESIGLRIARLERGEKVSYGVLDPAAFASDGGPSIAERIYRGSGNKVAFRKADNARVGTRGAMGGWDQMRARMIGEDGRPMVYCFSTCIDSIRTIPLLQHDTDRLEDVDTDMEDHAGDEWRYACMSRPFRATIEVKPKPRFLHEATMNELMWNGGEVGKMQSSNRRI
jgi:hypothetical protein